jgi:O-methyltransferase involved in polyketide biosynthesis
LAEGLLGYLEEPKVHRLFEALDPLAASGSFLLTDVSGQSALNEPSFNFWLQRMATNGIIGGRFGTDDPASTETRTPTSGAGRGRRSIAMTQAPLAATSSSASVEPIPQNRAFEPTTSLS